MTKPSPERFVPVSELLQVGLAACSMSYFSLSKKGFIEARWVLAPNSPLTNAMIATAWVTSDFATGSDPEVALSVARLYLAFEGKPIDDFMAVSERLLKDLNNYGPTVFLIGHTEGGTRYFEMTDADTAAYLIREMAKVYGSFVQGFADAVIARFNQMRLFISEEDSFLRRFNETHRAA